MAKGSGVLRGCQDDHDRGCERPPLANPSEHAETGQERHVEIEKDNRWQGVALSVAKFIDPIQVIHHLLPISDDVQRVRDAGVIKTLLHRALIQWIILGEKQMASCRLESESTEDQPRVTDLLHYLALSEKSVRYFHRAITSSYSWFVTQHTLSPMTPSRSRRRVPLRHYP